MDWFLYDISLRLERVNCVLLWSTKHARMMSGIFSRLLSSCFNKQRQHPFNTPNARSMLLWPTRELYQISFENDLTYILLIRFNLPKGS